jgi:hypothetical protein
MAVFENVFGTIQTKIADLFGIQEYIQSFHAWQITLCLISVACFLSAAALILLAISHVRLRARVNKSSGGKPFSDSIALQKRPESKEITHS